MNVYNLKIGQTLPLTQAMKNLDGKPCAAPNPVVWSNSNTGVVQLSISTTNAGAKALAPGTAIISLAGGGFEAESIQINVARPDDSGVDLLIITGTPH